MQTPGKNDMWAQANQVLSRELYADNPLTSECFFCSIHTATLADQPSFPLRVYLSRAVDEVFRPCLFEYMYNPPRTILDMRLQGTAHSSE